MNAHARVTPVANCTSCRTPIYYTAHLYRCLDCKSPLHERCLQAHLGKGRWRDGEWALAHLGMLLQEAHSLMDDLNAAEDAGGECRFCGSPPPYDADGIKHADDCIIVRIRLALA